MDGYAELMVFVKQLETIWKFRKLNLSNSTQPSVTCPYLNSVLTMEIVFVILEFTKVNGLCIQMANVEPIVTTMVWAFVFVTLDSCKQLTEVVWLEQHAHHQVQETTKEIVFCDAGLMKYGDYC